MKRPFVGYTYLNKADKSDPNNYLRVLCIWVGPYYFRLTWAARMVEIGDMRVPVAPR